MSIASTSAGGRNWYRFYCYEMTQIRLTSFAHDKSLSTPFENSFDDKLRPIKSVLANSGYIYGILIFLKVQKNINIIIFDLASNVSNAGSLSLATLSKHSYQGSLTSRL